MGSVVLLEELHGAPQPLPPGLLVPLPHDPPPVAREPAPRAEPQAHVHPQPVVRGALDDVGAQAADLQARGDAAPQQLGHGEIDAGAPGLLVLRLAADGQHLEQPRVPELRAAAVLDERAIEGRAGDVRVGGDESRGQHAVARVQRLVDLPLAAAADVNDAGALHDDHAIAQQAVTAAVEGDDPARSDRDAPGRHFATIAGSRRITT